MAIAGRGRVVPLELGLSSTKRDRAQGLAKVMLTGAILFKRAWWHAKAYVPIASVLMLSLGSLLVLHVHWLYRRVTHISVAQKEALRDVG